MKKLIAFLSALVMFASLCVPAYAAGLDNFQKVNTYVDGQFTDVSASSWYADNVKAAYEYIFQRIRQSVRRGNRGHGLPPAQRLLRKRRGL